MRIYRSRKLLPVIVLLAVTPFCAHEARGEPPPTASARGEPPPTASSRVLEEEASTSGSGVRTAGWITMGGSAVLLSGSGLMFYLANRNRVQTPGSNVSTNEQNAAVETYTAFGRVLLVAGLVSVATGVTLVLIAPKERRVTQIDVSLGPGQFVLRAGF